MENIIKTQLIKNYIKKNNLSKAAFCKQCRIGAGTLNKILNNANNLRVSAVFKIARVLKIEVHKLFND